MDRRERLNDQEESFRAAFQGLQTGIWTALPAIVLSVDLERQTIAAQCAIKGETVNKDGTVTPIDMPVFADVVLCFPRAGGYAITFPVTPGDEVLVFFASRCIDGWWQSGGQNNVAPEFRMHDLSDSFAILAPTSQPKKLSGVSSNALRVMKEDATKYIEISSDKITIESDGDVDVNALNATITATNATVTATNTLNLNASVSVNITAPDIYLNGTVHP